MIVDDKVADHAAVLNYDLLHWLTSHAPPCSRVDIAYFMLLVSTYNETARLAYIS